MGTIAGKLTAGLFGVYLACAGDTAWAGELDETLYTLKHLNRHSSLEPAGARGSIGMGVGTGVMQVQAGATPAYRDSLGINEDGARESVLVPRIWLTKGLPVPVDLGFAASALRENGREQGSQVAGQLQWTFYEDFATPAFGVRASHARLFGLDRVKMRSDALDVVASYGFLRYFTIFGSLGILRHRSSLAAGSGSELELLLSPGEESRDFDLTWTETIRAAGVKVAVWPPFVTASAEAELGAGRATSVAGKLSVGM